MTCLGEREIVVKGRGRREGCDKGMEMEEVEKGQGIKGENLFVDF